MIQDAEAWWHAIDKHWTGLTDLIYREIPPQFKYVLGRATPRRTMPAPSGVTMRGEIDKLKERQDAHLSIYLKLVHQLVHDSGRLPRSEAWNVLCELVLTGQVLHESYATPASYVS